MSSLDPVLAKLDGLASALTENSIRCPQLPALVRSLVTRGPDSPIQLVTLGELGRGKTTLVNRLLGKAVMPTGAGSSSEPMTARHGSTWRGLSSNGAVLSTDAIPLKNAKAIRIVEGPAEVLEWTQITDTPGMNDTDDRFAEAVIVEALAADIILFCVSATQLLSESERHLLEQRILPIATGALAIVVTHMDLVETAEDHEDVCKRVARLINRGREPAKLLHSFLLPPSPAPLTELRDFIHRTTKTAAESRLRSWQERAQSVLALAAESARAAQQPESATAPPRPLWSIQEVERLISREHSLAIASAQVCLGEGFARLRKRLPELLKGVGSSESQERFRSTLAGTAQGIAVSSYNAYERAFRKGLGQGVPQWLSASISQFQIARVNTPSPDLKLDIEHPQSTSTKLADVFDACKSLSEGGGTEPLAFILKGVILFVQSQVKADAEQQKRNAAWYKSLESAQQGIDGIEASLWSLLQSETEQAVRRLCQSTHPFLLPPEVRQSGTGSPVTTQALCDLIEQCEQHIKSIAELS